MRIGDYMTALQIEAPTGKPGPTNQRDPKGWTNRGLIYAGIVKQVPVEQDLGDRIVSIIRVIWRTHYRPDIDHTMRLRDGETIWRIENAVNVGGRNAELELTTIQGVVASGN